MENILTESTAHSPLIDFNNNGQLKLEGRCLPEDVNALFDPLVEFVEKLKCERVVFDVNLEYFNTATSKKLLELIKHIDANNKIGELLINWHYEEGDDDSLEMGEIYEECTMRAEFRYIEYAEMGFNS